MCMYIASKDRVSGKHLHNNVASGDMSDWTFMETLPNVDDIKKMKEVYAVLIGRVLAKRMKWMKEYDLKKCVTKEIFHLYSEAMAKESEEESIGIRNLYEIEQMDEIIAWIHELIAGVQVIKKQRKVSSNHNKNNTKTTSKQTKDMEVKDIKKENQSDSINSNGDLCEAAGGLPNNTHESLDLDEQGALSGCEFPPSDSNKEDEIQNTVLIDPMDDEPNGL